MNRRHAYYLICSMMIFMLSGCWDETNIEEQGFIIGFAIDLAEENKNGQPQLTVTNQLIIPTGIGTPSDGGGGSNEAFMNLSATGESIFVIDNEIRSQTSKMPFFEHTKLIVISEDVLEVPQLFPHMMDLFIRNNTIRRGTKVIVAQGEAKKLFEVTPKNEKVPALYLDKLLETNSQYTGGFNLIRLGEINEHFLLSESFTIPQFTPSERQVEFSAEAVFNGTEERLLGTLKDTEIDGLHLILGTYGRGPIEFNHREALVTYNIEKATSQLTMDVQDLENISISVEVETEGRIVEVFGTQAVKDPETIREIEEKAAKKIEDIVKETIQHAHEQLRTDIFGLKRELRQRHYDTWEKVKDNWDSGENYFSKSTFHVHANVTIHSVGDAEKSQK